MCKFKFSWGSFEGQSFKIKWEPIIDMKITQIFLMNFRHFRKTIIYQNSKFEDYLKFLGNAYFDYTRNTTIE